jgi:hypothetical protein
MTRIPASILAALVLVCATTAFAQTTGSVNGTVTDNTGAVLPGVTVTASSPVLMGVQTALTNESGTYRFPSLPPGTYRVSYELAGFNAIVREEIVVNLGFTATINVQLQLASLQETVTVSGASPLVDVTNSNIQTNFTAEMLSNLPNARDIWSLIGEAPGMMVTRFDVGGSRAGTQTSYSAYGYSGQVRIQIDGVNTTEGTGAAGFYYDYGSFDEIQLGGDGNDASAATPGVQLNAVIKSGGNRFRGDAYLDYENKSLQGQNITDRLQRLGVGEGDRILTYYDPNVSAGGPIKKDKMWYFGSVRNQRTGVTQSGFPVEEPSDFEFVTKLQNGTYKVTYALNQNNKIGHYLQMGRKVQPHRDAGSTSYFNSVYHQDSISYASNIDWNSVVSPSFFFNTRVATFGYNWPNLPYSADGQTLDGPGTVRINDDQSGNTAGTANRTRNDRRRLQFDWTANYFKDNLAGANHTFKFGMVSENEGQIYDESGFLGGVRVLYNSPAGQDFTVPYRVEIRNTPRANENWSLHHGAFLNDQLQRGRVSLNVGVRWDYYTSSYPDQTIVPHPYRDFFYAGAALPNGYSIPASPYARDFKVPAVSGIDQQASFAPRVGVSWDVFGNGKTTIKGNYGRFYNNLGLVAEDVNPLQSIRYTFAWSDSNGDRRFQNNEFGAFVSSAGGASEIDPDKKHRYTDSYSMWIERELVANLAVRAGYTLRSDGNQDEEVEVARVGALYTDQRTFADNGPDGLADTADDGPPIVVADIPAGRIPASSTIFQTVDGLVTQDRSVDFTLTKRMSNRWSLVTNFLYNWDRDKDFVENPNDERFSDNTVTIWSWKAFSTIDGPWGLLVTPTVRHQAGDQLARLVRITLRTGTLNYRAERIGSYREDNIWLFDTRVEKRFRFGERRLSLLFDAFNIGNSNAAETMDDITGRRTVRVGSESVNYQRFMRPTNVLSPRIFRVGFKLAF